MTDFENALQRKTNRQYWLVGMLAASAAILLATFSYTWFNFESLYDPYRSAYPRASTVFSPLNMIVVGIVCVVNGITFVRLKGARERLALVAFVLICHCDETRLTHTYRSLFTRFLKAAGLPEGYSLSSLKKMNMRHFMVASAPINRTIARNKAEWTTLSRTIVFTQKTK